MRTIAFIFLLILIAFSSCHPTCGTKKVIYHLKSPTSTSVQKVVPLAFHTNVENLVVNPLKIDSLNSYFDPVGVQFEPVSIIPSYFESVLMLDDLRDNWKNEKWFIGQSYDSTVVNVYLLLSATQLRGYVPRPTDLQFIHDGYNNIFVYHNFSARTLAHEIGHWYLLNHNFKSCRFLMGYGDCSSMFEAWEILEMNRARTYRQKYEQ